MHTNQLGDYAKTKGLVHKFVHWWGLANDGDHLGPVLIWVIRIIGLAAGRVGEELSDVGQLWEVGRGSSSIDHLLPGG